MTVVTIIVMPLSLCMGFPVFLLAIVNEKEKRLIEVMKINGMKMSNYWIVNYFFYYIFYFLIMSVYLFFGKFMFKFQVFTNTSLTLLFVALNGWGMA